MIFTLHYFYNYRHCLFCGIERDSMETFDDYTGNLMNYEQILNGTCTYTWYQDRLFKKCDIHDYRSYLLRLQKLFHS